ncbi:TadE family protein [Elusimicrobiota bacterium]
MIDNKGQALTESVFTIPIIVMIIFAIAWFGRIFITKQQLTVAARYGTDLISNTKMSEEEIRTQIQEYLCSRDIPGRRLDPGKLRNIAVHVYRDEYSFFPKLINFDRPSEKTSFFTSAFGFSEVEERSSHVELSYSFNVPGVIGNNVMDEICISARSEVLAGTRAKE